MGICCKNLLLQTGEYKEVHYGILDGAFAGGGQAAGENRRNCRKRIYCGEYRPGATKYLEEYQADKVKLLWAMKKDWYDLDFLYLKKNPEFRAFCIYEQAIGFENHYMDIFAEDAFDNRREYITGWYRAGREGLEREYPYFTEGEAEAFVEQATDAILEKLSL